MTRPKKTITDLFSKDRSWCRKYFALTIDGRSLPQTSCHSWEACRWCLDGALSAVSVDPNYPQASFLRIALEKLGRSTIPYDRGPIWDWNDDPSRTIEEVRQFVREIETELGLLEPVV